EKKAKLFNEWERFTSNEEESIESYYHRFLKLMIDLKRNKHFHEKIASNLKFLNNLQPEWSRHHKFHADGTLSHYKAHLVTNGSSQQLGVDFDETFSLVVKPATILTVLSLAMSRKWLIYQLDVKNAFLNGDLSETRSLYGLKQALRAWFQRFAGLFLSQKKYALDLLALGYTDADWAGCPSTCRCTFGYYMFLGDNLLSWSGKRQHIISRSSGEAKYQGVANVVAETTWLHNLLCELHSSLFTSILVYCDNVRAVYISGDLYLVTKPSTSPISFLSTSASTWHERLGHLGYATHAKFYHCRCDSSRFIYRQGSQIAYLLLYGDDIILTASSTCLLQQIIDSVYKEFDMTDLGALNYFLGIFVVRHSTVDSETKLGPDGVPMQDPTLYRSLAEKGVEYIDADWTGCPSTRRSTSGYCVFLERLGDRIRRTSVRKSQVTPFQSAFAASLSFAFLGFLCLEEHLGVDFDETFSPVVKPATIHTVLSLAVSRKWPIHQLDVKNAFLNGDLSETVYMHQLPGFVDVMFPNHVFRSQRSLYGLKLAPRVWFQRLAGLFLSQKKYALDLLARSHMVNCNMSRTPVDSETKLGPNGVPVHDPTLYRSLGTLEPGLHLYAFATTALIRYTDANWAGCPYTHSAEAEYRGVANVVAETALFWNLLCELQSPLFTATLVDCDNVSAVYMCANPFQHQRNKHNEIDILFVRIMIS
nr:ribonuclease H-like domain-containing protein [Tanacetum cinerariifolium]